MSSSSFPPVEVVNACLSILYLLVIFCSVLFVLFPIEAARRSGSDQDMNSALIKTFACGCLSVVLAAYMIPHAGSCNPWASDAMEAPF
jgi:hypothetical protein